MWEPATVMGVLVGIGISLGVIGLAGLLQMMKELTKLDELSGETPHPS